MSTTSTVPEVIDSLLALLATDGRLAAFESWPGPEAAREMLVLGTVTWEDYRIATIKSGRKQRQEDFEIAFEVFVVGATGTSPAAPSPARARAFELLAVVEDMLADDPKIGVGQSVQWVEIRPSEAEPRVFEKGWAFRITGSLVGHARLL